MEVVAEYLLCNILCYTELEGEEVNVSLACSCEASYDAQCSVLCCL